VDFDFLPTQRRVVGEKPSTSVGGFFHYGLFHAESTIHQLALVEFNGLRGDEVGWNQSSTH
jgi:hypothetical protein